MGATGVTQDLGAQPLQILGNICRGHNLVIREELVHEEEFLGRRCDLIKYFHHLFCFAWAERMWTGWWIFGSQHHGQDGWYALGFETEPGEVLGSAGGKTW